MVVESLQPGRWANDHRGGSWPHLQLRQTHSHHKYPLLTSRDPRPGSSQGPTPVTTPAMPNGLTSATPVYSGPIDPSPTSNMLPLGYPLVRSQRYHRPAASSSRLMVLVSEVRGKDEAEGVCCDSRGKGEVGRIGMLQPGLRRRRKWLRRLARGRRARRKKGRRVHVGRSCVVGTSATVNMNDEQGRARTWTSGSHLTLGAYCAHSPYTLTTSKLAMSWLLSSTSFAVSVVAGVAMEGEAEVNTVPKPEDDCR